MRKIFTLSLVVLIFCTILVPAKWSVKSVLLSTVIYPKYLPTNCSTGVTTPGDGTPFAVYVVIQGYTANKNYAIKSRIGPYSTDMTYAISWKNELTNQWANDSTAFSNLLKITTDASGNWSGWLIAKVQRTVPSGVLLFRMRMKVEPYDGGNLDSFPVAVNSLNMTTEGGWIEGHAYIDDIPVANGVVVVKDSAGNIVGTYLTEDNGVLEGYSSPDTGYFKVGVPADNNYTIELWNPLTNIPYPGNFHDIAVSSGQVTSFDIRISTNTSPTLDWTGEEYYDSDGLNPETGDILTDFTYRVNYFDFDNDPPMDSYPEVHILKDGNEISGSPFLMGEDDLADTDYRDGKVYTFFTKLESGNYTYFFEAKDNKGFNASGVQSFRQTSPSVFNLFSITASSTLGGNVSPSGNVVVRFNESQEFIFTPEQGYHINDILVDGVSQGSISTYTFTNATANHTIEATFAKNTHALTVNVVGSGSVSLVSGIYEYGTEITLNAVPATGFHFIGWSGDATDTDNFLTITIDSNKTIAATFAINTYTITASAGTGGTVSPSSIVTVNYGDSKSFEIKAYNGFMIYRVLVDGSPITISNPLTIAYTFKNVTSNHTILAEFMKILDFTPPTVTLPKVNGIDLNISGTSLMTSSDTFTFIVEASDASGIARMVVKVNGVVQVDKNNLDPVIYLSEGTNNVEVIVYDTYGNYTTKSFKVYSDAKPPVVNLTVPEYTSTSPLSISGFIYDEASGVKKVLINNTEYLVGPSGTFEALITLTPGVNTLTVRAEDKLGNYTLKTYSVTYTPSTSKTTIITLTIDSPYINVNGISQKIDAQGSKPIIKNGRTFLPIRTLIEFLGGTVEWNAKEQKFTTTLNSHSIALWIGKTTALVDGNKTTLDVAPFILNGRTYLPLRFISENLGAVVDWDATTKAVTIYYWS